MQEMMNTVAMIVACVCKKVVETEKWREGVRGALTLVKEMNDVDAA